MSEVTVYTPKPGSLPWRVLSFLMANVDEELTRRDIAVKFDCQASSVDAMLQNAVGHGCVRRTRNSEAEVVWSLGKTPCIIEEDAETELQALNTAKPTTLASRPPRQRAPEIDLDAIKVRKGVRLMTPEERRRAEFMEWFDQFDVGDSAEFDEVHTPTNRAESKRHAQASGRTYKIAATAPGRYGVERTA
jgi:hypothetical protein